MHAVLFHALDPNHYPICGAVQSFSPMTPAGMSAGQQMVKQKKMRAKMNAKISNAQNAAQIASVSANGFVDNDK